ncbi:hypothetical protein CANCADRAFT_85894 [Tortispora caseinolytica NRRL Y-17796]|uniref:Zinc/iron permease n=1 Tax=Tortispora caseinolytica NRRL Y-17796 TaxID=767744 RepID=A0A1E4TKV7_9ASCO|nr:hypothetical protein CANCADRAFT_85894 [Tortispora caseinolytica NRRL Y-17796]
MSSFLNLVLLCILMGVASFLAGLLPMMVTLSDRRIRAISMIGMGILVGTSMEVVIPEGVETLYHSVTLYGHERKPTSIDPTANFDRAIGVALVLGFMLMHIIDQVPKLTVSREPIHSRVDLTEIRGGRFAESHITENENSAGNTVRVQSDSNFTTFGLVVHAVADGIAIGASALSDNSTLETIVFLAVLVHKAPAAFSLVAVLLRQGIPYYQIRLHLLTFSLAAPAGALLTWAITMLITGGSTDSTESDVIINSIQWWTGVILVFSGGTFLYVAIHVMQEVNADSFHADSGKVTAFLDIMCSVFGMCIPFLTYLVPE